MNPSQFNSRIYGYSTSDTIKNPTISDNEMKTIVDSVLHQMNTQPHNLSYYNTVPTSYSPQPSIINKNQPQKNIEKKNTSFDFTPEFYNVLKSMISKEVEKKMNEKTHHKPPKDSINQTLLKKISYYEKKINFLEEQILILKNNFL